MTDEDLREFARRGGREGGREAAREILRALGVDVEHPLEAQKDMHFLRDLRKGTSTVKGRVINTIVAALAMAGLYKLFSGLKGG